MRLVALTGIPLRAAFEAADVRAWADIDRVIRMDK
jgi:hypothetical protein